MQLIKFIIFSLFVFSEFALPAGQGITAVEKAGKENKHLFLFFYKDLNERTLRSEKVFDQTMQKSNQRADFIKVNANDSIEKDILDKFDLNRSPMPFVLVLAPTGAVTGGFPSSFTEAQLIGSFVSPAMGSCLKGLQDKKLVFLCLQNNQTIDNEAALKGVEEFRADKRFGNAAEVVMLNPADIEEQKFLNQLGVDTHTTEAITILLAPPAETIGIYQGAVNKDRFIADLKNAVSECCGQGGCCPGGKCK